MAYPYTFAVWEEGVDWEGRTWMDLDIFDMVPDEPFPTQGYEFQDIEGSPIQVILAPSPFDGQLQPCGYRVPGDTTPEQLKAFWDSFGEPRPAIEKSCWLPPVHPLNETLASFMADR